MGLRARVLPLEARRRACPVGLVEHDLADAHHLGRDLDTLLLAGSAIIANGVTTPARSATIEPLTRVVMAPRCSSGASIVSCSKGSCTLPSTCLVTTWGLLA